LLTAQENNPLYLHQRNLPESGIVATGAGLLSSGGPMLTSQIRLLKELHQKSISDPSVILNMTMKAPESCDLSGLNLVELNSHLIMKQIQ
jgi:hypothetical protein